MSRRTMKEIERDYTVCRKYVNENPSVCSFREIAEAVNLTEKQVRTCFERHPRIYKSIQDMVLANQEASRAQRKAEQALLKAQQKELEAKREAEQRELEAKRKAEQQELEAKREAEQQGNTFQYVIDASITGIDGIIDSISNLCAEGKKIVLTTVTIRELEKMQKFQDTDGYDARRILAMAADDPTHFKCVCIDESLETPDDCIVKFCADNHETVILLTADKTMALKARAYEVNTRFFKHTKNEAPTSKPAPTSNYHTLRSTTMLNGKLYIDTWETPSKSVRLISDGIEYRSGTVKLQVGDNIYIATKKENYLTFAHYRMISESLVGHCILVHAQRFYDVSKIDNIENASYKSFMREFRHKIID